jgi:hypothetical protein
VRLEFEAHIVLRRPDHLNRPEGCLPRAEVLGVSTHAGRCGVPLRLQPSAWTPLEHLRGSSISGARDYVWVRGDLFARDEDAAFRVAAQVAARAVMHDLLPPWQINVAILGPLPEPEILTPIEEAELVALVRGREGGERVPLEEFRRLVERSNEDAQGYDAGDKFRASGRP